jgi:ankyrin repeat protein
MYTISAISTWLTSPQLRTLEFITDVSQAPGNVRTAKACATGATVVHTIPPMFSLPLEKIHQHLKSITTESMARNFRPDDDALPGLLKLPNELLFDIVSCLSIPDLRHLSRVSRRLYFFAREYLARYRYKSGLVNLPNEIILEVVQLLNTQKDRSRFARSSQRFYPLVMNYVVRHNIRYGESSFLNYASKRNLKGMAQRILHLGGNVHSRKGSPLLIAGEGATPLATAACYGHERMVRLFLKIGARQRIDGCRAPLAVAIAKGHENVALILSQDLESNDTLRRGGNTILQYACEAKFASLVRFLLPRNSSCTDEQSVRNRSIALYSLLDKTACKGEFVKRELLEDVYQIVLMLLRHNADPDLCVKQTRRNSETARHIAPRHPDPRVRNLLSIARATPLKKPEEHRLQIGPSLMDPLAASAFEEPDLSLGLSQLATLWDFLQTSDPDISTSTNEHGLTYSVPDGNAEYHTLGNSDIQRLLGTDIIRSMATSIPLLEPPPLSSYPQLSNSKMISRHADQDFWARMPLNAIRSDVSFGQPAQKAKQVVRPIIKEAFPQLGRSAPTVDETGKAFWARFSQNEHLCAPNENNQMGSCDEANERQRSGHKKSKKKQWIPLLI